MTETLDGCMLSLLQLVVEGKHQDKDLHRFPGWFGVDMFPNL